MLAQARKHLALLGGDVFVDCTLGGGGHSQELIRDLAPNGMLIGIDQDESALVAARQALAVAQHGCGLSPSASLRVVFCHGNFGGLDGLLLDLGLPAVNAVLFDLGVSSPQLDTPSRGFSYSTEAPLDMRMNPGIQTLTAAEIINTFNATDLTRIIHDYGQERWARRIAEFIVATRARTPIRTSRQLVELVYSAIPAGTRRDGGNPAKRTFQALRIAVNDELGVLEKGLDAAVRWLAPGGRIVVISYHSLEDRMVKQTFAALAKNCSCPPGQPVCTCDTRPVLSEVGRLLRPDAEEIEHNRRAHSARLRWAIKAELT
jgi:16S rRNA (cytosine1402-N4)-methyltransferase